MKKEIDYDDIIAKITTLLEKSETRIDKTNEMVCKLASTIDKLTNEYGKHLERLQEARDELVKQNKELIKLVESCRRESELTNRRYDTLLEKTLLMSNFSNGRAENNITVK